MQVIVVSGTPGTGKTTVAKKLARQNGFKYVDVNALIRKFHLAQGYDKELRANIVDPKRLVHCLIGYINASKEKGLVIDSHLAHDIPSRYVSCCVITKTSISKLRERLKRRGYSLKKVQENLDAENMDVCLHEAEELRHKVRVITT